MKRIFSGWMFAASPGLHGVEHPIYDIWLTDCKGPDTTVVTAAPTEPPKPAPAPRRPRRSAPRRSAGAASAAALPQQQTQQQPPRKQQPPPQQPGGPLFGISGERDDHAARGDNSPAPLRR